MPKANKTESKPEVEEPETNDKIITREMWKKLEEYWDSTEYKDLKTEPMKKILGNGKYLFVKFPKDVTVKKEIDAWVDELKVFKEKSEKAFGGKTICFKGDKTTLSKLFGDEPIISTQMPKILWAYIKEHELDK